MDYVQVVEYITFVFLLISTLFQIKQSGPKIFVLRFYTVFGLIVTRLKLSKSRQPFFICITSLSEDDCFNRLILTGYQWDYFAYHDEGEMISMRCLYDQRQVHVRIYRDGAVHMHDEPNYEFDPVGHLKMPVEMPSTEDVSKVRIALTGSE